MASGQAPDNFQMHHATDFHGAGNIAGNMSIQAGDLDVEQFIMEHNHAQNSSLVPHNQPEMDGVGTPPFGDFSFSFHGNGPHGESRIDNTSDPYGLPGPGSASDHRNSVTSMHRNSVTSISGDHRSSVTSMPAVPRASFSNGPVAHPTNASISGSEDASPSSNRAIGLLEGYGDDFLGVGGIVDGSDLGNRTREEKNDPNPPWSELKTKAGKERKRLPLACIACRRKKIRCSGEKPACKHCLRSRIPCVYKVTTRKAAPRTDYMAMLDKRLKRMEERIIKIVPKDEQDGAAASVVRATVKPAIPGTVPVRPSTGKKRAADEAFGQELEKWSKSASHAKLDSNAKPSSLMIQEAEDSRLLSEGAEALPPKELQEHLAEMFFENLYGQTYHLLHQPSFMRKLKYASLCILLSHMLTISLELVLFLQS